jgi:polysaccharide biosynthesis/export protein
MRKFSLLCATFSKSTTHKFLCLAHNLNLMKKNSLALYRYCIFISAFFLFFCSCTPVKNVVYFENLKRDTILNTVVNNNMELRIRKNDLLYIGITSPDPVSTLVFNSPQGSVTSSEQSGSGNISGYQVDNAGNIVLYKLGTVHVEGLTRTELKLKLQRDLTPYLKDAVVTIRFLNNHITVLGEVGKPQVITMQNEQLSILEALGLSGDITITGRKDNILVIRETSGQKEFKRLNITDKSVFSSPFYYLKPDDVVYVEPTKVKIKNSGDTQQMIGYILSGVSIAVTILFNLLR